MWFDQLERAIPAYYPPASSSDIVGYLRGDKNPAVWRTMEQARQRHQMLLLGSIPPTQQDWIDAGVAQRTGEHTIVFNDLWGFIVIPENFVPRPWGSIHIVSAQAVQDYPKLLNGWMRGYKPPRP